MFFIIECKPKYDLGDDIKLHNVLSSQDRLFFLYRELRQYKLLAKINYDEPFEIFSTHVNAMLANSESYNATCELKQLIVQSWLGEAIIY